ncbi:MAG: LysR family transcriptional regulator [Pseudomonadota bacterium]
MKFDPRHLEILAAVVDQGGLTEGARALGKSQPSVSRSLSMLENRLGVPLFAPGRRPLQPSELCHLLAEEGRRITRASNAASALVAQTRAGTRGAVRVAGTPIFMDGVVSPTLASFQSELPDIQIAQSYGYTADVLDRLMAGTLDLGLVPIRQSEVPPGLNATQILPGRNVIACRIGHPLARRGGVRLSEIARYPWIAPPPESPLYHDLRAVLDGIGVTNFKVSFSGGSLGSVTNVLSGSDALTVLPYSVVFMLRRQNALAALPVRIGDPDRHLNVIAPENASPAGRKLVRFIRTEFVRLATLITRAEQNSLWRD